MSQNLEQYKSLVDRLKKLSAEASESEISEIDVQLKLAWEKLCDSERSEAEAYWDTTSESNISSIN